MGGAREEVVAGRRDEKREKDREAKVKQGTGNIISLYIDKKMYIINLSSVDQTW